MAALLVLLGSGAPQTAPAQAPQACPAAREPVSARSVMAELGMDPEASGIMLWRFRGEQGEGHVFGTVHLGPPHITRGPPRALLAIRASDVFASEIVMDAPAQAAFERSARVADGVEAPLSEGSLGPALFARYLRLAGRRGIPPELASRLTPWAAFLSIGRPPIPPGSSLDETLQHAAQRMGRRVVGLQSIDELLAALDGLSAEDQLAILTDTLCQEDVMRRYYHGLLQVYSSGAPEAVVAFSRAGRERDPVLARLEARMVTQRNTLFVVRIRELLPLGRVFVAVGAQHLPGPDGVLEGLRRAGFTVERAP